MKIPVLFTRADSVYNTIASADPYDEIRDARNYKGNCAVVAHPPCRAWGRLRTFAKPLPHEKDLARFAVDVVKRCGGVLEHPASSSLWADCDLPRPGKYGLDGSFTLPIYQSWFGHRAIKPTWLFIKGIEPSRIPSFPLYLGYAQSSIEQMGVAEREHTPVMLAHWLVQLATLIEQRKADRRSWAA